MINAYWYCVFRFWNKVLILLYEDPKVKVNKSSELFLPVETSKNEIECETEVHQFSCLQAICYL